MFQRLAQAMIVLVLAASPVVAHHISGTVYCDSDGDGVIDRPGDAPVASVTVRATSLDVSPGQQFSDATDGSGAYYIGLPARTDRYTVDVSGLPGGWSVVVPPGGTYTIQIITQSSQDHADNVDFLVQGCAPPTTTTVAPTTTTSMSTTTTTSPTTTTTLFRCDCPATPFLVARDAKLNNGAEIRGSVGANDAGGRVRLGKAVGMPDGTSVTGDLVSIGGGTSVDRVFANTPQLGPEAVVRGGTAPAALPILTPFCSLPPIVCGTTDVQVPVGETLGPLPPGVYGRFRVLNGGTITLMPGDFTFCDVKTGRNARIVATGSTTLRVAGSVIIGTASSLGPQTGAEPVVVYAAGTAVRVSQSAVVNAAIVAPLARISFGRDGNLLGCFCTDRAKSDKHITLACPAP